MKTSWLDRSLITGPYLALVLSEREFHKAMQQCDIPRSDRGTWIKTPTANATCHWLNNPKGEQVCIVALRTRPGVTGVQVAALLVHEAVHVWQAFRDRMGEDAPSSEFEAYSIQAISQNLLQAYADAVTEGRV